MLCIHVQSPQYIIPYTAVHLLLYVDKIINFYRVCIERMRKVICQNAVVELDSSLLGLLKSLYLVIHWYWNGVILHTYNDKWINIAFVSYSEL